MRVLAPLPGSSPSRSTDAPTLGAEVEVTSSLQIPALVVTGLPGTEVLESRERVRAALASSGIELPRRRWVVNLCPSQHRKTGTHFDLSIALALTFAGDADLDDGEGPTPPARRVLVAVGELGLDGRIKPSGWPLHAASLARLAGASVVVCAEEDAAGVTRALARWTSAPAGLAWPPTGADSPRVLGAGTLAEAVARLRAEGPTGLLVSPDPAAELEAPLPPLPPSPALRRALAIAAVGHHHLLLLGPAGCGKSTALRWLASLLPLPGAPARLQTALLREALSNRGGASPGDDAPGAPMRVVHPGVRPAALLGAMDGRGRWLPGELELANEGLLIADEWAEWARDSRECMRGPLEGGTYSVTRARARCEIPAGFLFAASSNLCPCGGADPGETGPANARVCACPSAARSRYLARLGGPLHDRFHLRIRVAPFLPVPHRSEGYESERTQVREARCRARDDLGAAPGRLSASGLIAALERRPALREALRGESLRDRALLARVALSVAALDGCLADGDARSWAAILREVECLRVPAPNEPGSDAPTDLSSLSSRSSLSRAGGVSWPPPAGGRARGSAPRRSPGRPATPGSPGDRPDPGGSVS